MIYLINNKRVAKKAAKDYVDKKWGTGTFAKREKEAKEYFIKECDDWCSWADGFAIKIK